MQLTRGTRRSDNPPPVCVATIGNFDGLHQGHREIIRQVRTLGKQQDCATTVISFEPLPTEYFSRKFNRPAPGRIYPLRDKARILASLGVDRLVCLKFAAALSEMSAEDFITEVLIRRLNVRHLIVGDDFRFGKQRRGDYAMLVEVGGQQGMQVSHTDTVMQQGERVSSTRIRRHLAQGEMAMVHQLLGEPYQLSGRVRHGDKRGRTLGFPTLNQSLPADIVAARGAYAVRVHGLAAQPLPGVANLGTRPSVAGEEMRLETHVFDFDESVYGRKVCVELVRFLRPERKFSGLDALMQQIGEDSQRARSLLVEIGD